MSRIDGSKGVPHDVNNHKKNDDKSKVSNISKKKVEKQLVSSSLAQGVSEKKSLRARVAKVPDDIKTYIKDDMQLLRENINRCAQLHSIVEKGEYNQAISGLKEKLHQLQEAESIFNYIDDNLPTEIKKILLERYIVLQSVIVADLIAGKSQPDASEEQYEKISCILEKPFSESSLLRLLAEHSFNSALKRFSHTESMSKWTMNRFMYHIYSELVHIIDNVELPNKRHNSKTFIESKNERAIELAILRDQL